jgi:hypothetical protein
VKLKAKDTYSGVIIIKFDLTREPDEDKPLFIDYHGEKLCKFTVNGESPVHVDFDKHRILVPSELL